MLHLRASLFAALAVVLETAAPCAAAVADHPRRSFINTTYVHAVVQTGQGTDAGIDVSGGSSVRLTSSGRLASTFAACVGTIGPEGCERGFGLSREVASAPVGMLVAAFTDGSGRLVSPWMAAGPFAVLAVPQSATRLIYRVNGGTRANFGAFRVTSDVSDVNVLPASGIRRILPGVRQLSTTTLTTRKTIQTALRRFGFSDTPANVTYVYRTGLAAWVKNQLSGPINDDFLNATLAANPVNTGNPNSGQYTCTYGAQLVEHEITSKHQLLEKMTMHWLEHFSVNGYVSDGGPMGEYLAVVRADALGNFAKLVSDVSVQPIMLNWLSNGGNVGSDPKNPPNQNFGRELMQLYVMGPNKLNMDGTTVLDSNGIPVPTYSQNDVDAVSLALTGFSWYYPNPYPAGDPKTIPISVFTAKAHGPGPYSIIGQTVNDPGNATVMNSVVTSLASNPSTAPFESKELLERFVTENPSPGYVSRIAAVWAANVSDPNQIAKVVTAITSDPEFPSAIAQPMLKEPVEYYFDAIRALGGVDVNHLSNDDVVPFSGVRNDLDNNSDTLYDMPTVFGFYTPGYKDATMNNGALLFRYYMASRIAESMQLTSIPVIHATGDCYTNSTFNLDGRPLMQMTGSEVVDYLLDALVDGGNPELRSLLDTFVGNDPTKAPGAAYIILSSPEYEVN